MANRLLTMCASRADTDSGLRYAAWELLIRIANVRFADRTWRPAAWVLGWMADANSPGFVRVARTDDQVNNVWRHVVDAWEEHLRMDSANGANGVYLGSLLERLMDFKWTTDYEGALTRMLRLAQPEQLCGWLCQTPSRIVARVGSLVRCMSGLADNPFSICCRVLARLTTKLAEHHKLAANQAIDNDVLKLFSRILEYNEQAHHTLAVWLATHQPERCCQLLIDRNDRRLLHQMVDYMNPTSQIKVGAYLESERKRKAASLVSSAVQPAKRQASDQ